MATITITDLEVFFCVGVPDEERAKPQRLLITIEMNQDFTRASVTDDIAATIDYYAVSQKIIALGRDRHWKLIEKLANDISNLILNQYQPIAVTVTVRKFPIPQAAGVSVCLTKKRDE